MADAAFKEKPKIQTKSESQTTAVLLRNPIFSTISKEMKDPSQLPKMVKEIEIETKKHVHWLGEFNKEIAEFNKESETHKKRSAQDKVEEQRLVKWEKDHNKKAREESVAYQKKVMGIISGYFETEDIAKGALIGGAIGTGAVMVFFASTGNIAAAEDYLIGAGAGAAAGGIPGAMMGAAIGSYYDWRDCKRAYELLQKVQPPVVEEK